MTPAKLMELGKGLYNHLKGEKWFQNVVAGVDKDGADCLYLYVKSLTVAKREFPCEDWEGVPIIMKKLGQIKPLEVSK
jgi:hypothetical protein